VIYSASAANICGRGFIAAFRKPSDDTFSVFSEEIIASEWWRKFAFLPKKSYICPEIYQSGRYGKNQRFYRRRQRTV